MRLINAATVQLEEFYGDAIPEYAILSHRWLDEEVSLQDLQSGAGTSKAGYRKIQLCCEQAVRDGLSYAWVDTCCIDKTSSAELTEAINSMYAWYRESAVCYAYISDVTGSSADDTLEKSAWFTRGWTLQELLAPGEVVFYSTAWERLGTRDDGALTGRIALATGIDEAVLRGNAGLGERSVAQRMSWAAGRTTTRAEDSAYSLLGLFGVNMPMLYGEGGARAFVRLQEEIMKASDDQSLFAWAYSAPSSTNTNTSRGDDGDAAAAATTIADDGSLLSGLLARSPAAFAGCGAVVAARQKWNHQPYAATNRGLSLEMPMVPWGMETFLAALDCEVEGERDSRFGIYMRMLPGEDQFARILRHGEDDSVASTKPFAQSLARTVKYRKAYVQQRGDAASGGGRRREKVKPKSGDAAANTTTLAIRNSAPNEATAAAAAATPAPAPVPVITPIYGFYIRSLPMRLITAQDPQDQSYPISEVTTVPGGQAWDDTQRIVTLPAGGGGTVAVIWLRGEEDGCVRSNAVKVGFDDDFNPVVQYGGMLGSPGARAYAPDSYEGQMHPSWMTVSRSDYLFRGNRSTGLLVDTYPWRVSLIWAVVGGDKTMWVLDIEKK
ncbi:Vegetative incompatibility protein HET-E-1 [Ilyonectria robusta]